MTTSQCNSTQFSVNREHFKGPVRTSGYSRSYIDVREDLKLDTKSNNLDVGLIIMNNRVILFSFISHLQHKHDFNAASINTV